MALNVGGSASADYKNVTPGYVSPFGGNTPSIKKDYDWGSFGGGTDWDQTPEIDRTGLFESLFDKARSKEKYRSQVEDSAKEEERRAGNGWGFNSGNVQRVTENASVYNPPQMPIYTAQGIQGRPGFLGGGGGQALAAIGGLALAPVTGGASLAFAKPVGEALGAAGRTWNI